MSRTPRSGDIQLEAPTVRSPETVPAVEDRSYLLFILSAFFVAIAGGFLIATILPLIQAGTIAGPERIPRLIQAHGWAQLQGWAGLFVAGMALRLLPRFAGRRPLQRRLNLTILALLLVPIIARTIFEPFGSGNAGRVLVLLAAIVGALGTLLVGSMVIVTLLRGRRKREPWRYFALFGGAWWIVWALLMLIAGAKAWDSARFTPAIFDDTLTWVVMLGSIGNFIWAVQSRSVPVFFGRKTPPMRRAILPLVVLNVGVALLAISLAGNGSGTSYRLEGLGFTFAGIATAWLAPLCGAISGTAHRLRPGARAASRFVLAANIAAIVAGIFLAWAGLDTLIRGEYAAFALRDAARHAFGVGLITMLILGMAQLVAPVFALSRAESRPPALWERAIFWLLVASVVLRVAGALLDGHMDEVQRLHLVSTSGALAWIALVLFATMIVLAIRREPRMKALLGVPT